MNVTRGASRATPDDYVPYDQAAEQAVLCAMLLDGTAANLALAKGSPDLFYRERHGLIFGAMQRLAKKSSAIDPVTLRNELDAKHELDTVGGLEYIATLIDAVPSGAHVADHLRIVADKAARRRLLTNAALILEAAHNGKNLNEVATLLQATAASMAGNTGTSPTLIRAADVQAVNVTWLWAGRLPFGKLTCLDGDPGLGKSTILYDIAARYTRGSAFPDGSLPEGGAGHVLVCTAEDGYNDTVKPRLMAAGADIDRVTFFDAVNIDGQRHPICFPDHVAALEQAIVDTGAKFVTIDPLFAFLGGETNTWNDANMRQALSPLQDVAERLDVALVVIRHWTKGSKQAIYRGGGSIGISGAARSVLLVGADPDYKGDPDNPNDHRRVLAVVKANLAMMAPSLSYRLVSQSVRGSKGPVETSLVEWLGSSVHRADTLAMAVVDQDGSAVEDAREWLLDALDHGPRNPLDLRKQGEQAGHSWASIRRAKDAEGIKPYREGFGDGARWMWKMPLVHEREPGEEG